MIYGIRNVLFFAFLSASMAAHLPDELTEKCHKYGRTVAEHFSRLLSNTEDEGQKNHILTTLEVDGELDYNMLLNIKGVSQNTVDAVFLFASLCRFTTIEVLTKYATPVFGFQILWRRCLNCIKKRRAYSKEFRSLYELHYNVPVDKAAEYATNIVEWVKLSPKQHEQFGGFLQALKHTLIENARGDGSKMNVNEATVKFARHKISQTIRAKQFIYAQGKNDQPTVGFGFARYLSQRFYVSLNGYYINGYNYPADGITTSVYADVDLSHRDGGKVGNLKTERKGLFDHLNKVMKTKVVLPMPEKIQLMAGPDSGILRIVFGTEFDPKTYGLRQKIRSLDSKYGFVVKTRICSKDDMPKFRSMIKPMKCLRHIYEENAATSQVICQLQTEEPAVPKQEEEPEFEELEKAFDLLDDRFVQQKLDDEEIKYEEADLEEIFGLAVQKASDTCK